MNLRVLVGDGAPPSPSTELRSRYSGAEGGGGWSGGFWGVTLAGRLGKEVQIDRIWEEEGGKEEEGDSLVKVWEPATSRLELLPVRFN